MKTKIALSFIGFIYGITAMLGIGLIGILGEIDPSMVTTAGVVLTVSAVIVVISWVANLK